MEATQRDRGVLEEALEIASARLEGGDDLVPLLITDRWGDQRIERFPADGLAAAREQFAHFVQGSSGGEACALVYLGRDDDGEDAIVIERGGAGYGPPAFFRQRFRPRRGRFRGFKLRGDPELVPSAEQAPQ